MWIMLINFDVSAFFNNVYAEMEIQISGWMQPIPAAY